MAFLLRLPLLDDKGDRLLQTHLHRVEGLRDRNIFLVMEDIRAKTSGTNRYRRTLEITDGTRKFEEPH